MCGTCGCDSTNKPGAENQRIIELEIDLMQRNQVFADANRSNFRTRGILCLNLVSSPGSGKTTLLCATIKALKTSAPQLAVAVIEGDQQTRHDADKINAAGAPAIQINTGRACHLDAHQISHAAAQLALQETSILFVENIGNLVCPAGFDLGEDAKVVILSTTEGEDKPLKYPDMFAAASLMIINKSDLSPYVDFNATRCIEFARRVNPNIEAIQVSATTGEGMQTWLDWLNSRFQSLTTKSEDVCTAPG